MNRNAANRVLAAACAIFLIAVTVRWFYRHAFWAELCLRVAEAALVGGIADWFAVTALFRKPLGFSYHTALIPRNREKIAAAMAQAVEEEFLSWEAVQRRLQKVRLVKLLIGWMDDRGGKQLVTGLLRQSIDTWLEQTDKGALAQSLATVLRDRLRAMPVAGCLSVLARRLSADHEDERLFSLLLGELKAVLKRPGVERQIYAYLQQLEQEKMGDSLWRQMAGAFLTTFDIINLEAAAAALHAKLLQELAALEQPDHPLRQWLRDKLLHAVGGLEADGAWQQAVEEWKTGVLDRLPLEAMLLPLLESLRPVRSSEVMPADSAVTTVTDGILRLADRYWETFRQDAALQDWLEEYLQEAAVSLAESEHTLIGELVQEALGALSDEELNRFIEEKVGDDLAWIRINGSVVGALAGLVVTLLGHYIYLPYIWPLLQTVSRIH